MWSFDEAVEAIRGLRHRGWRLGLDRMEELCDRLEVAQGGTPAYLHVAGTNGKGSTVALCESILRASGVKTGATYSPYVYDVRERITDSDGLISREDFAAAAWEVMKVGDLMEELEFGGPTEFEAKTAMGFYHWNRKKLDAVVLETGLGGRLDATNIVIPKVSVITSIGLDHMAILGDTVEKIAFEKAGIIKKGVPTVVGRVSDPVYQVLEEVAFKQESKIERFNDGDELNGYEIGLKGEIMKVNAWVAKRACEIGFGVSEDAVLNGLANVKLPGRFETVVVEDRTFIFDGAHNAEAMTELVRSWKGIYGEIKVPVIFGMLDGHDPLPLFETLASIVSCLHVVPINWTRTWNPEELCEISKAFLMDARSYWSVEDAVNAISDELILVTGSYYLLGEVREFVD